MLPLFRRAVRLQEERRREEQIRILGEAVVAESRTSAREATPEAVDLLQLNQQALVLFITMVLLILLVCRHGFGWAPGATRPTTTRTIYFGFDPLRPNGSMTTP
jgi:hypothetical protein